MQQHTMTAEACDVTINGLGADSEVSRDLAAGHAADGLHKDELVEVWALLPVRDVESLATEGAITSLAEKPLDTFLGNLSSVVANLFVGPAD
jgi:hypothetical protein